MSVYSGFTTRQQETFYNKLVEKLLDLMQTRLIKFFKGEQLVDDARWAKQMKKIHKCLVVMDKSKYLIPKYSETIDGLATYLHINFVQPDGEAQSTMTSDVSLIVDNKSDFSQKVTSTKSNTLSKITDFSVPIQKPPLSQTNYHKENLISIQDHQNSNIHQVFNPFKGMNSHLVASEDKRTAHQKVNSGSFGGTGNLSQIQNKSQLDKENSSTKSAGINPNLGLQIQLNNNSYQLVGSSGAKSENQYDASPIDQAYSSGSQRTSPNSRKYEQIQMYNMMNAQQQAQYKMIQQQKISKVSQHTPNSNMSGLIDENNNILEVHDEEEDEENYEQTPALTKIRKAKSRDNQQLQKSLIVKNKNEEFQVQDPRSSRMASMAIANQYTISKRSSDSKTSENASRKYSSQPRGSSQVRSTQGEVLPEIIIRNPQNNSSRRFPMRRKLSSISSQSSKSLRSLLGSSRSIVRDIPEINQILKKKRKKSARRGQQNTLGYSDHPGYVVSMNTSGYQKQLLHGNFKSKYLKNVINIDETSSKQNYGVNPQISRDLESLNQIMNQSENQFKIQTKRNKKFKKQNKSMNKQQIVQFAF
ncbi:UNKNOWN [Stylonychia lemnae]|uniref:Uncharacterized protein n=1 Tax=Stylonychia lemnae TaxID=5949 RepID=A0A078A5E4_STYLE|nr:UNKNOWN [Stylonychia lemnae]|eukprot:CDW77450.1 UNKNOWN [Stylonychia lemnae]